MDERAFYTGLLWSWLALAPVAFVVLLFKTAPYGRFARPGWGPTLPGRSPRVRRGVGGSPHSAARH